MSSQKNIWMLDKWYAQSVAGNTDYVGERTLYAWGYNDAGQIGQNQSTPNPGSTKSSPIQIGSATDWRQLAYVGSGREHISCLRTDYEPGSGTLYGWGTNAQGTLGLSNTVSRSSPTQTYQGSEWKWNQAALGYGNQMGVLTNGKLYVWGYNNYGNLGLNQPTPTSKDDPDSGSNLGTGWAVGKNTIAASAYSQFAIKDDGSLWSWGRNNVGQLGVNNDTTDYSSPVQIPGTWSKVFAGADSAAAINTSGELFTWGDNPYGILGHSNQSDYSSPKQLPGTTWATAAFGPSAGTYLKTTGELYMCGRGTNGRLAQNNQTDYSSPRQIPGTWIKACNPQGCQGGIKADGSLWTWGGNGEGKLGHNDQTSYSSPKQVPGTWIDIVSNNPATFGIKQS
jgi:alpha-tubulin suppressor-like RCC1 family protein